MPAAETVLRTRAKQLPIGLQITGPAGREDLVLTLARAYQSETNWHTERPAL
ncbi:MAG TPA: hypothetical protein VFQ79_21645 [Bryobacteraceae bacterium]|nr:hypothetical protein [Bryobacteraceae bacterium]